MKSKKLVSLGMAAVMSLSLAVPAFADATNTVTNFTATYAEPVIAVTVPQTGTVALNPLGLDVEMDASDADQTIKGHQIVTTPTVIVNKSKMELDVNAKVTTMTKGKLTLVESETELGNQTGKAAFAFFEMKASEKTDPDTTADINKEAAAWAYDYSDNTAGCLVLQGDTKGVTVASAAPLVTLAASDDGSTVKDGGMAQMRIAGKMVQSPQGSRGDDPWATTDGLNAVVTFTFTVHPASGG